MLNYYDPMYMNGFGKKQFIKIIENKNREETLSSIIEVYNQMI